MASSMCSCGVLATRLVKAMDLKRGDGSTVFSMNRSASWASCEAHRHNVLEVMKNIWRDQIAQGEVKVLMGKRHRAGL